MEKSGVGDDEEGAGTSQSGDGTTVPYRKLVENAHEGIAIIQDEEFVYCNERFAELFETTAAELRGQPYLSLVDEAERATVADRYERRLAGEDPPKQYRFTTDEGRVVETSGTRIEYEGRPADLAVVRDVTERERYENALDGLHEITQAFPRAETSDKIASLAVEIGRNILDVSELCVYLLDEDEGVLEPVAVDCSDEAERERATVEPGDDPVWTTFVDGTPERIDAASEREGLADADGRGDTLVVPLGEHGVLVAQVPTDERAHDRCELVETLAATTAAALDRAERESELRSREAELSAMADRYEQVKRWADLFRRVVNATYTEPSAPALERAVCETFVEHGPFEFAWIGGWDHQRGGPEPRAVAGDARGYLSDVSLSTDDDPTEPTLLAAQTRTVQSVPDVVQSARSEPWQRSATQRGFRSVVGVPLEYRGVGYGVLGLYSSDQSVAGEFERDRLTESGGIVAACLNAHRRQEALLAGHDTELDFELSDLDCFLYRFARDADCTLRFDGVVPDPAGENRVRVTVEDAPGAAERFRERVANSSAVTDLEQLSEGARGATFSLQLTEPFIGSVLAAHGLSLRGMQATERAASVTVGVPAVIESQRAVAIVTDRYPGATMIAKRSTPGRDAVDDQRVGQLFDRLTDRQRETLERAYRGGYFDSPKGQTGEELAESLGIASSTFHDHLNRAQREVFEALFEDATD
ncbi:bacterio-opsin activator domain-containing protein [Halorientalis salina]|uniref:bacterio-opsin activator domain-containing protein n=1 Tax=Halorientalis salina TaxID=2932266 RepID=UPI0010ACAC8F|nr:bacterio-opsin activator domain-containing protein [Halorientalis salina]